MNKDTPLLPFAYTKGGDEASIAYDTSPRPREVIDANASSSFHTRTPDLARNSQMVGGPPKRVPLPLLVAAVPRLKRKLTSYSEHDNHKRQNLAEVPPSDDVETPDTIYPPSSPPVLALEYDEFTSQHFNFPPTLPDHDDPVLLRPRPPLRAMMPSLDADFGIDRFNRYKPLEEAPTSEVDPHLLQISLDKARQRIMTAFEECNPLLDLEGMELTDIPDEIADMEDLVVIGSHAHFQVYASNNQLRSLQPLLFQFKKIEVLGLRHNKIETIPPLIGELTHLTDLNLAANRIKWLPWQFLHLAPNLKQFGSGPNPWLPVPDTASEVPLPAEKPTFCRRYRGEIEYHRPQTPVPLLQTWCLHHLAQFDALYADTKDWKRAMDPMYHELISRAIWCRHYQDRCSQCEVLIVDPMALVYEWWDILQQRNIPIRFQFCSDRCVKRYQNQITI